MNSGTLALQPARPVIRTLATLVVLTLVACLVALVSSRPALAQEDLTCQANHLGTLGDEADSKIRTAGRWTTNDCDSRFRTDSDAHTYRFIVLEGGRIRIDLKSADRDSYLYLMAEDGSRITDSDGGGAGLDARVEYDLTPGVYIVEATTVGSRERGPASFSLSISRVTGCEPEHLGALQPGVDLTASGFWTLDTCGSRFVVQHPAYSYYFDLPQDGRVRIDLRSQNGDPVMSLVSLSRGLISANDDGGGGRNSRIEQYLLAGTYLIEATTYLERDLQPQFADFTLVVHLIDEEEREASFNIKMEEIHVPDEVVAGEPFEVHYRVGNLGQGGLDDVGGRAAVYVVGPRVFDQTPIIYGSEDRWQAGVSYHTGPRTATPFSVAIDELEAFDVTLNSTGPSWVFVAVDAHDGFGEEVAFHGIWRNLMVLSGLTFEPVMVSVDDSDYEVSARANAGGYVTTSVTSVADPGAAVDPEMRAKAIYAAGVRTQLLDGIFERPEIAALSATAEPEPVSVANPSSDALAEALGDQYANDVTASGLVDALGAGEVINPVTVEDMTLAAAQTAAARFAGLSASWSALQERIAGGEALSFAEALAVQSQIAYAESVIPPTVKAGEIVEAARAADTGWQTPEVQDMLGALSLQASCGDEETTLSAALEEARVADDEALLALDDELRAALPVYSLANDSARCAASDVDAITSRFLQSLLIAGNDDLLRLLMPRPSTVEAPAPHRLRIIAQLDENGRIEHGVELSNGEQILPTSRFTPADSPVDAWLVSSDVEMDEKSIGNIRSRRLEDGRIELGFIDALGEEVAPDIRYIAANSPAGVWLRSGEIEAPPAPPSRDRPADYTQAFVLQAIERYEETGKEATVAYYNTKESVDGQWYVFIIDENQTIVAHAPNPDLVGKHSSQALGPNSYPTGSAVAASADQDGAWFDYTYANPASGVVETKHSWVVTHDGITFGSGWYERGPGKSDAPAYTKAFVQQAINLYDALGLEETIAYYNTEESVDGQWYVFIVDQNGYTIAHHNPEFRGRDPSLRVDATGYFYGDDLLGADEDGRWVDYVLLNPESGEEQQKHTWAVRYNGLIFASGWYE